MGKMIANIMVCVLVVCLFPRFSYGETIINDPRYCGGEPKRDAAGKIVRSITERKRFEAMWSLPTQFKRKDWQVDHTIPLSEGGCDTVVNMQWLPKVIKTCADASCKDRWERKVYQK